MGRYVAVTHIPRGSADATWHVVDTESDNHDVVVIVDPHGNYTNPDEIAMAIAEAMNTCKVLD